MKCPNKSHSSFRQLVKTLGSDELATLAWQRNGEEIPDIHTAYSLLEDKILNPQYPNYEQRIFDKDAEDLYDSQLKSKNVTVAQKKTAELLLKESARYKVIDDKYAMVDKKYKIKRFHTYNDEKYPEDKFDAKGRDYSAAAEKGNQIDDMGSLLIIKPKSTFDEIKAHLNALIDERNSTSEKKHKLYYTDEALKQAKLACEALIKEWKKDGGIVLTQISTFNLQKKVGGTIDVVVIDRDGNINIHDFKVSKNSVGDSTYKTTTYRITEAEVNKQIEVYDLEWKQTTDKERKAEIRDIIKHLEEVRDDINRNKVHLKATTFERYKRQQSGYKAMVSSKGINVLTINIVPFLRSDDDEMVTSISYEMEGLKSYPLPTDKEIFDDLSVDGESEFKEVKDSESKFNQALENVTKFIFKRKEEIKQFILKNPVKQERLLAELDELDRKLTILNAAGKINTFIDDTEQKLLRKDGAITQLKKLFKRFDINLKAENKNKEELHKQVNTIKEHQFLLETYLEPVNELVNFFVNETGANLVSEDILHGTPLELLQKIQSELTATLAKLKTYQLDTMVAELNFGKHSKLDRDVEEAQKQVARYEAKLKTVEEKLKKGGGFINRTILNRIKKTTLKELGKLRSVRKLDAAEIAREIQRIGQVDITMMDMFTNPLSSSNNKAIGLFVNMVSDRFTRILGNLMPIQKRVYEAYEKYKKVFSGSNDPETHFKGIYEVSSEIKYDNETGKLKELENYSFIEDFNRKKFNEEYVKMSNEFKEMADTDIKAAIAFKTAWNEKHLKPTDVAAKLKEYKSKVKDKTLPLEAYQQLIINSASFEYKRLHRKKNGESTTSYVARIVADMEIAPQRVLNYYTGVIGGKANPFLEVDKSKFINENYQALFNTDGTLNAKGQMHKVLTDQYIESQKLYPPKKRLNMILPQITKSGKERFWNDKIGYAKYNFSALKEEKGEEIEEYGIDTERKIIPTQFTKRLPLEDISLDLVSSVMRFAEAAERYSAAADVHAEAQTMLALIEEYVPAQRDAKGLAKIDAAAQKIGLPDKYLKKHKGNLLAGALEWFIDNNIYGKTKIKEYIPGTNIRFDKAVDAVMRFMSFTQIGGDVLMGISNSLMANTMILNEARAGEWYNVKEMHKAKKLYLKYASFEWVKEFGDPVKESFVGQIEEFFSPQRGEHLDQFGRNVSGTAFKKIMDTNTWFALMSEGEREAAITTLMAMLEHKKVKDSEGKDVSMLDLLIENYKKTGHINEFKPGKKGFKEGVDVSNLSLENDIVDTELQRSLYAITNRMQGVYNGFDRLLAKKTAIGRLILMYRNHVVPGFKRRFKMYGEDINLGITEGTYITFFNKLAVDGKNLMRAAFPSINNLIGGEASELSPYEQANVRRAATEMLTMIALMGVIMALKGISGDDDKKRKKAWNYPLYLALRLNSEIDQYIPLPGLGLKDFVRTMFNPTASYSIVKKGGKLLDDAFTFGEDAYYKKDVNAMIHKGDAKWWVDTRRLMGNNMRTIDPGAWIPMFSSMGW